MEQDATYIGQLMLGLWASKTLAAATELDVFSQLSGTDGVTVAEAGARLGMAARPAEMLLTACASLGLLSKADGRYRNTPTAEAFLVRGRPQFVGDLIQFVDRHEYRDWERLADALRTDRPVTWDVDAHTSGFDVHDAEYTEQYHAALYAGAMASATALADVYGFADVKTILDVGGGTGVYDIFLCRRYPHLQATIFELPSVCEVAAEQVAAAGLRERIKVVPGSFLTDDLPPDHDLILLSGVLHNWDPATAQEILRKSYLALPPGGRVMICELFVNDEKTGPTHAALMSLNMLVKTRGGRNYTAAECRRWLADAGFVRDSFLPISGGRANGALIAEKPRL